MGYRKLIIVISGGKNTGLVKISGDLDGGAVVTGSVRSDTKCRESKLYLVGTDVAEVRFEGNFCEFKLPFTAKSEVICVLESEGQTLFGTSGNYADKRSALMRIEKWRNGKKTAQSAGRAQSEEAASDGVNEILERSDALTPHSTLYTPLSEELLPLVEFEKNDAVEEAVEEKPEKKRKAKKAVDVEEEKDDGSFEAPLIYDVGTHFSAMSLEANATRGDCGGTAGGTNSATQPPAPPAWGEGEGEVAPSLSFMEELAASRSECAKLSTPHSTLLEEGVMFDGTNFYLAIKPQLDEMFVCYPEEKRLNAIVPNSKWVRVDTESDYYVVGVLFDQSDAIFICYGIPGVHSVKPPKEIADVCVWLPLSLEDRYGDGFWVIYQSADNGKCVK